MKEETKQEKLDSLIKKLKINRIIMITLLVIIFILSIFKVVHYCFKEKISYDKTAVDISESNVNTGDLYLMQFNKELITASEEVIFVNSKNREAIVNFTSAASNRVLVRAEIFTDVSNLKLKPNKKFWTKLLYPKDYKLVRIGDTGWIESGKIIEKIKLDELPSKTSSITVRYTAVNPANPKINTGMFSMITKLVIVDYKGNMLDENGKWQKVKENS